MSMVVVDMSGPIYGNYDECLSIESPPENEEPVIRGKYCYLDAGYVKNFDEEQLDDQRMPDIIESLAKLPNGLNLLKQFTGKFYETTDRRNKTKHLHKIIDTIDYVFPREIKLTTGYCLPTTCKAEDISRAINQCESDY
jgi:hypothetical protein